MSTLSDGDILEALRNKVIEIDPISDYDTQIQPCSVDLRLLYNRLDGDSINLIIKPGEFILGSTIERVKLPDNILGRLNGRSSIGRLGLQVENAGFIDPGFNGQITLELVNFSKEIIRIPWGTRICQLSLEFLHTPSIRPYGHPSRKSKYQNQVGVTESRIKNEI